MSWPSPHPRELLGRPSRKGAGVVLEAHLQVLLGEGIKGALAEALREQPALGGQERRYCAFAVRELSRHMRILDLLAKSLGEPPSQWARREDEALVRYTLWRRLFTGADWTRLKPEVGLPGPIRPRTIPDSVLQKLVEAELPEYPTPDAPAQRHSFPNWLAERVTAAGGEGALEALNQEPALWFRARPPGSRNEVAAALSPLKTESPAVAPDALKMLEPGTRVFDSEPAKRSRLQAQDLGSQLIVQLCAPFEDKTIVDYCAGAGGKTLYLADLAGEVIAHDKSKRRLDEGRARVKELRLKNVTFAANVDLASADLVLIDAPCSGSGSLAREPERKWKINAKEVEAFAKTQRELLETVAKGVRAGASIVYATCSLLQEENEDVVRGFLSKHGGWSLESAERLLPREVCRDGYLRLWPQQFGSGGFFGARLKRLM
ncbi:MAG: RsmB/NOP family class I SAM-dependent RNA methyltransferase [Myxococcaceae bacterium]